MLSSFRLRAGTRHTQYRRDSKAAGQDGRVAVWSAVLGHDACDTALMQQRQLGRGELDSNHQRFRQPVRDILEGCTGCFVAELALDQANDLDDILSTGLDVFIVHAAEF